MREIKFRGKRIDNGRWAYGYLFEDKTPARHLAYILEVGGFVPALSMPSTKFIEVDPDTVGEYTDRKEKNGKEVYEGDIFGNIKELRSIVGREENGAYVLKFLDSRIKTTWSITDPRIARSEVIGNIYEHGYLLDTKTEK